jgi:hypothetical protein
MLENDSAEPGALPAPEVVPVEVQEAPKPGKQPSQMSLRVVRLWRRHSATIQDDTEAKRRVVDL